jgi:branched-chain amino acid transport system permease protein
VSLILPALVSGVVLAGLYGLLASGIVIVFNTSGVINFAQAAIAILSVFVTKTLLDHGPGAGSHVYFGAAAVIGVCVGALTGFLIDRLTLAPIRASSPLNRSIVTIGWLLFLQAFANLVFNAGVSTNFKPILSQAQLFAVGGLGVSALDLGIVVTALAIGGVLALFFTRTHAGIAMRAAAQDVEATKLMGVSVHRVSGLAWALAGALAAIGGILVVPQLGSIDSSTLTTYLIQAFAAALLGGLRSLPRAAAGALLLGIGQSMISILPGASSLPGLKFTTAFVLIVGALFLRPDLVRTGVRDASERVITVFRAPWWSATRATAIVGVIVFFVLVGTGGGDTGAFGSTARLNWAFTFGNAIVFLSLVLLTGFVGQISLCQLTFAGFGAFFTAIFTSHLHVPLGLAIVLAAACTAPIGVLVGVPALRIRGLQLAVVTIAFALVGDQLLFAQSFPLSGGELGQQIVTTWGPLDVAGDDTARTAFWISVGTFALLAAAVEMLRRSPSGRALFAVRDSESAATAVGISLTRVKLGVFALSAGIAAIGGAVATLPTPFVSSQSYNFGVSILYLALIILAGIRSVWGALVAATFLVWGQPVITFALQRLFGLETTSAADYQQLLSGALLIVTVILNPRGLVGALQALPWRLQHVARSLAMNHARRRALQPPAAPAHGGG